MNAKGKVFLPYHIESILQFNQNLACLLLNPIKYTSHLGRKGITKGRKVNTKIESLHIDM